MMLQCWHDAEVLQQELIVPRSPAPDLLTGTLDRPNNSTPLSKEERIARLKINSSVLFILDAIPFLCYLQDQSFSSARGIVELGSRERSEFVNWLLHHLSFAQIKAKILQREIDLVKSEIGEGDREVSFNHSKKRRSGWSIEWKSLQNQPEQQRISICGLDRWLRRSKCCLLSVSERPCGITRSP